MHLRVLFLALLAFAPLPAMAQPLFATPLGDAAYYRNERGPAEDARYSVRYEVTIVERGGAPSVSEMVIDVGPDWSLVRNGDNVVLRDFRLNREFSISGDTFTTMNGIALLTFRVMERQNRSYLQRALDAARNQQDMPNACDAESELGMVIPGADAGVTAWRNERGGFTLRCAERDIGAFTAGDGAAPPPAFWPTMYSAMTTHPALHRRVRETGRAPAQMEISFRNLPGAPSRRSWRLIAIESVQTPYPLSASMRNVTAQTLDRLAAGSGQLAAEAIAGRAEGGAPTWQSWNARLAALARSDGEAAAAMFVNATFNMFPEQQCEDARPIICTLTQRLRTMPDPAPWAVIEIAVAEQQGNLADALAAMRRAQASPHRNHPVLGASFALALLRFDEAHLRAARAANLPTDIAALQNAALAAAPYNPAYWTDVGDRFGRNYEWPSAFLFYDVAYALPMPSAVANNMAMTSKRQQMERIRRDFPDASLPSR